MKTGFNIYDYVQNNKFSLKVEQKGTRVTKGYNDIRKTNINEVKIGQNVEVHVFQFVSVYSTSTR